jgi:hypothetical protein
MVVIDFSGWSKFKAPEHMTHLRRCRTAAKSFSFQFAPSKPLLTDDDAPAGEQVITSKFERLAF